MLLFTRLVFHEVVALRGFFAVVLLQNCLTLRSASIEKSIAEEKASYF